MANDGLRVRMTDVADKAGVSTATVGRVLHNRGYVSEDARKRVEQAIQETGFQINLLAQSLRRQRSYTIGHILSSLLPNPFFAGVEVGVEEVAVAQGYNVVLWNAMRSAKREREGVEAFIQRQVEAVIFTTPRSAENVELALRSGLEVVQVERSTSIDSHVVLVDNYSGARAAVEHLLQLGHKRIGYLGKVLPGSPEVVDNQRFRGYRDALATAGIPAIDEWIILELDPYSIQDGNHGLRQLLVQDPEVTAVLAFSDIMAAGVLQAAYDLHLRVPDQLSVIGFDNTYAPYLSPPLSTVAIPMIEVGKAAAQVAINAIENRQRKLKFYGKRLATELIVRGSSAAPLRSNL
ncbi:MAG: LacI family DNA-binding transcriptional regulator [Caldilineaceae bacterium]